MAAKTQQAERTLFHNLAGHTPIAAVAHQQAAAQPTTANEAAHSDQTLPTKETRQVKLSIGGFLKGVGNDLKGAGNDVKNGLEDGVHGAESLAGSIQKDANGFAHTVMQPNEPAGWLYDTGSKSSELRDLTSRNRTRLTYCREVMVLCCEIRWRSLEHSHRAYGGHREGL